MFKKLEENFTQNGYTYSQNLRDVGKDGNTYALYHVDTCGVSHFEVIQVKFQKATRIKINGNVTDLEAREKFPGSHEWGRYGWTYRTYEEALNKFTELITRVSNPKKR